MDYEKKYKEALERAKAVLEIAANKEEAEGYVSTIFPELKESEDERIRKELIKVFSNREKYLIDQSFGDITVSEILTWLEKQGESSDKIHYWTEEEIEPIISDYLRGAEHYGGMIGRLRCLKPKSLEKQDEKSLTVDIESMIEAYEQRLINQGNGVRNSPIVNMCVAAFKHGVENTMDELHLRQGDSPIKWNKNTKGNKPQVNHSVLMKTTYGIAEGEWIGEGWKQYRWAGIVRDSDVLSWIELSDLEKQGERKPQRMVSAEAKEAMYGKPAWSEKDDKMYNSLTEFEKAVKQVMEEAIECGDTHNLKADADMLLRIAQKSAWSEEDKKEYKYVLKFVDNILNNCDNDKDYDHCKRCYDWLQSLKQRIGG